MALFTLEGKQVVGKSLSSTDLKDPLSQSLADKVWAVPMWEAQVRISRAWNRLMSTEAR